MKVKNSDVKFQKFSEVFPWQEFYDRYVMNYEEFTFIYNNDYINLVTDKNGFLYNIGTKEKGFKNSILYKSPKDLLDKARFNGKTLREIWDDLR